MSATLPLARAAFINQMNRDTIPTERPRLLAVLDAMIAWSAARPDRVRFRADTNERGIVRFEALGAKAVIWAATPRRNDTPVLDLLPGASRFLSAQERAGAIETLSAHTRETLDPIGRLHIGFGALKNANACTAVLALMDELLEKAENVARQDVA
jgi:hypothetical protein